MHLPFVKYQATGNDFIVINNTKEQLYTYDPNITKQLCHRQFGIGADGIITLEQMANSAFGLWHYNADGSRGGGLCGNGGRAALHYAHQLGLVAEEANFSAIDGPHKGYIRNELIELSLKDVCPIQKLGKGYFLDNGTRHYIEIVEAIDQVDMMQIGFPRRTMAPFEKEGVNLNFVQFSQGAIYIRTCECGLDAEPLSCGTGAVAGALVAHVYGGFLSPVTVITRGGSLSVAFTCLPDGRFTKVKLIGPVSQTFYGTIELKK